MYIIIKFLSKWILPIGFVELICKLNDNVFNKDSVPSSDGKMTYWRISGAKNPLKGAGVLIRRS